MAAEPSPVIAVRSLNKQFPGVVALDDVSLEFFAGQVHGLIGENGAGKSTLMKILSGLYQPRSGSIEFGAERITLAHPADAQQRGIVMIHQELNLVEELSVAENIWLGREPARLGFIDRRQMIRRSAELLRSLRCEISPRAKVRTLSIAQKQMVEIARALSYRASVLILDEPTAVLTGREIDALFEAIGRLKQQGVAIIYISHLLPEVLRISDRITVLRDGRIAASLDQGETRAATPAQLASLMVGRPMGDHFPARIPAAVGTVLQVENISVPGRVRSASFAVRRGEILGFAGLIGAGRTELAEAIAGLGRRSGGRILIDGREVSIASPQDAVAAGIAYVSEDRKGAGLTLGMSVAHNITMASLARYAHPLIDRRAENAAALQQAAALGIRAARLDLPVDLLSGGNQQKVALAKWLQMHPKVLIVDEPTRGVDVGAKEQIYAILQRLTAGGMATILISSELNEVLGLSHRIAVMRGGEIVAIVDAAGATEQSLMRLATGAEPSPVSASPLFA